MTRSLDQVVRLWMEGYSIHQIARRLRMSPSAIYGHCRQGTLVLPERLWATAETVGLHHTVVRGWHRKGWVRKAPCGLYHVDDMKAMVAKVTGRPCVHPGCTNVIENRAGRSRFCLEHRLTGVDPERLLRIIAETPGIGGSRLSQRLGVSAAVLRPIVDQFVEQGVLCRKYEARGKIAHYAA